MDFKRFQEISFCCHVVPLGSIPELPAETCNEIKASEGNEMINSEYWIYSDGNDGKAILARCEGTVCIIFTSTPA